QDGLKKGGGQAALQAPPTRPEPRCHRAILAPPRACGGIGRRARLRALWETTPVEVRVLSGASGEPRAAGLCLVWGTSDSGGASRLPLGRRRRSDRLRLDRVELGLGDRAALEQLVGRLDLT